jgi:hypothetical protein
MEVLSSILRYNINTKYPIYTDLYDRLSHSRYVCIDILYLVHNKFIDYTIMNYLLYIRTWSTIFRENTNYSTNKYLIYIYHTDWSNDRKLLPNNIVYLALSAIIINFNKLHTIQYYSSIDTVNYKSIYGIDYKINMPYLVCIHRLRDDCFNVNIISQYLKYIAIDSARSAYKVLPNIYRKISTIYPEMSDIIHKLDDFIKNLPYDLIVLV